jgi:G protein beta subunit-like protein
MGECHVNALAFSPRRTWLAAGGNPYIKLFDVEKATSKKGSKMFEGHSTNVISVGFHEDERWMFSASEDGSMKVWDLKAGTVIQEKKVHESKRMMISCAVLHPNQGEIVCGDESGTIAVWDLAANKIRTQFQCDGKSVSVRSLCVARSGAMVVANHKGVCYSYKASVLAGAGPDSDASASAGMKDTGKRSTRKSATSEDGDGGGDAAFSHAHKWQAHDTYCLKVMLSPDGKTLATSSADGTIKLWDTAKNYAPLRTLTGHDKWVWDMAFSADSVYMVSSSSDKTAKLWDMGAGSVLVEYGAPQRRAVTCVALKD